MRWINWKSVIVIVLIIGVAQSYAAESPEAALAKIAADTTFEVVIPKPKEDGITYDQPINFDLLPFSYRTDKYVPVGTAFALANGVIVTAAHVLRLHEEQFSGTPLLRDTKGTVYVIDQVLKYSFDRDFVFFTLKGYHPDKYLEPASSVQLNQTVFSVGNALGQGIVIRDGTYTSNTPEDREGRWKWLRFSAAASPGNSGGPLLDAQGKLLGIVTAKSPNENLNYALPINEALNAPDKLAVLDARFVYTLPNMDFSTTDLMSHKTALPLSPETLREKLIPALSAYSDSLLSKLLTQNKDDIFPLGRGAIKLRYSMITANTPMAIVRKGNGEWILTPGSQERQSDLENNGYVSLWQLDRDYQLLRIRKPDNLEVQGYLNDSKTLMDTILNAAPFKRETGYESRRVTSLGTAKTSRVFRDNQGRPWQVQTWDIPFIGRRLVAYTTPTPDGCVVLLSAPPVEKEEDVERDLNVLANFLYFPYSGTLLDWQSYLANKKWIADPLRELQLDYSGSRLVVSATDFRIDCAACISVSNKMRIEAGFGYEGEGQDVRLRLSRVLLNEAVGGQNALTLTKARRPPETLSESFTQSWLDIVNMRYPFDGSATFESGVTKVTRPIMRTGDKSKVAAAENDSRFLFTYLRRGEIDKAEIKQQTDALIKNVTVTP